MKKIGTSHPADFVKTNRKHIESWAGIACLVILAFLVCFLPGFARKNEALYNKLNSTETEE
ncbi:hypothetical protein GHV41_24065 [Serratia proteamaculans]|uniref:Uncharacterized protein n=1 Tax=Serratia proteamaculans TaxID=28151 RepID=A0A5Q2VJK8_SERPR|nr:hypothetical protein GHV41_24065 [Serratia proteamaculans]